MTRDVPRSFVKSCGGKVKIAALIRPYMPKNPTAYHEPCVGGGAMFFRHFRHVRPAYVARAELARVRCVRRLGGDVWVALVEAWREVVRAGRGARK